MDIKTLLLEKKASYEGQPAQDVLALLLKEAEDEGPNNDGLLSTYIKEAHEVLNDIVLLINEDILWRKILTGERTYVRVASTGKQFSIRKYDGDTHGLPAYDTLLPSGKIEKKGIILSKEEVRNWCYGLVEDR